MKKILITGASGGIGLATARYLADQGHAVLAGTRFPEKIDNEQFQAIHLDLSSEESLQKIAGVEIDVVIHNAGYAVFGAADAATNTQVEEQFEVNVFGPLRLTRALLPQMRERKSGQILFMSSLSAIISSPYLGIYSATKAALESIGMSLAPLLSHWNIDLALIEPGAVNTHFLDTAQLGEQYADDIYAHFHQRALSHMRRILADGESPEEIAKCIGKIVKEGVAHLRYPVCERAEKVVKMFINPEAYDAWIKEKRDLIEDWF